MRVRLARPDDGETIRAIYNAEVTGSQLNFDIVQWSTADLEAWLAQHQGAYPAVVAVVETGPPGHTASPGRTARSPSSDLPLTHGHQLADLRGADGQAVLGFGSLSRYRSRPAYATTVEDSVYVDRFRRGKGVGKAILEELLRLAADHGFHTVVARVVSHNEASVSLHRACGFVVVGIEKEVGRKHGHWLDVVELQRML